MTANKFIVVLVGILGLAVTAKAAAPSCHRAHVRAIAEQGLHGKTVLSEEISEMFLDSAEFESSSTTGDRREGKRTTYSSVAKDAVETLKGSLSNSIPGFSLEYRDKQKAGKKNVTWTVYSNRYELRLKSHLEGLTAKIRFRKYGSVGSDQEVNETNYVVDENFKDKSFLEFKIEHPNSEDSVLKPRILILDSDANLLLSGNLNQQMMGQILERTLRINRSVNEELNQKNQIVAQRMLKAIYHLRTGNYLFRPEVISIYARVSYVIPVQTADGKVHDIQLTIDEDAYLKSITAGIVARSYKQKGEGVIAVIEDKFSNELLKWLKANPDKKPQAIVDIENFLNVLHQARLRQFQEGRGKFFHLRQEVLASEHDMSNSIETTE